MVERYSISVKIHLNVRYDKKPKLKYTLPVRKDNDPIDIYHKEGCESLAKNVPLNSANCS